jgi:hypothetical protein
MQNLFEENIDDVFSIIKKDVWKSFLSEYELQQRDVSLKQFSSWIYFYCNKYNIAVYEKIERLQSMGVDDRVKKMFFSKKEFIAEETEKTPLFITANVSKKIDLRGVVPGKYHLITEVIHDGQIHIYKNTNSFEILASSSYSIGWLVLLLCLILTISYLIFILFKKSSNKKEIPNQTSSTL